MPSSRNGEVIQMKRILSIVGARPQFVKASLVSRKLVDRNDLEELLLHTGQHYDRNMSAVFFEKLGIPEPSIELNIHGGTHGQMTGRMLALIEEALIAHKPDGVVVYGDTNSTLAGALAAAKLNIPVAHVEAGLRSFNRTMPEEINRIITDHLSALLFCPTDTAVEQLRVENISDGQARVVNVGDVMLDAAMTFSPFASRPDGFEVEEPFALATVHRAENTEDRERLAGIVAGLNRVHGEIPVVIPLHPRTQRALVKHGLELTCRVLDPVGYLEMIWLTKNSELVLTDSGGLQKEAYFFECPCVTLREETEWVELVQAGANVLAGADANRILDLATEMKDKTIQFPEGAFGGGRATERIIDELVAW
jgi:UDP-GlcNAc3NAcA epimerase